MTSEWSRNGVQRSIKQPVGWVWRLGQAVSRDLGRFGWPMLTLVWKVGSDKLWEETVY